VLPGLEQRLAEDDVPAHVGGLLREERTAQRDRLLEIPGLAELVGERSEVALRVLVEFLLELFDPRGACHS
jgi:hypothetical protein